MRLKPIFKCIALLVLLVLSACNSPKQIKTAQTNSQPILIERSDLEQLKVSVAQWESSQPKVEQLLRLENKLMQLTKNLKQLNGYDVQDDRIDRNVINSESILKSRSELYALQVGAFKNKAALQNKLIELKALTLKTDNSITEVNIEVVSINGTTFYRLKLGAYINGNNAKSDCLALLKQQVSCFVSYYIHQPYK